MNLQTKRLCLILESHEKALSRIEGMTSEEKEQISPDWLSLLQSATRSDPWIHGFSIALAGGEAVIGSCGFKGPPDSQGTAEIAYMIEPEHQGKGYATEAALALASFAFSQFQVSNVRAHTLPEHNASTRVLQKCGFTFIGETVDPEDGLVWRWEKNRSARGTP